jgi:hypothetical protein
LVLGVVPAILCWQSAQTALIEAPLPLTDAAANLQPIDDSIEQLAA